MPTDKWGIPFFYPTKATAGLSGTGQGFFWEQSNDVTKDDDFTGNCMLRIGKEHDSSDYDVINTTTGEWTFPFNFDGSDGLSLSGPTGHHTGGETHGCQGFTYMINVSLEDSPPQFRFRKETYHVQYDNHPEGLWTHPEAPDQIVGGGWFGYGWVAYNKKDGRGPGKDSRVCECWWNNNPDGDITNWKMLKRVEDKGAGVTNWGVPATCDGEAYQVGTWSNIQFRFKVDASDFSLHPLKPECDGTKINSIGGEDMSFSDCENRGYGYRIDMPRDIEMKCLFKFEDTSGVCHLKNVSIREIDPTASFDDNQNSGNPPDEQPPEPTTVQGSFKLQWNDNSIGASACAGTGTGGGGGTGNSIFYTVPNGGDANAKELSTAFQNRSAIGEIVQSSASIFAGKKPRQIDVWLKKVGTPAASPTVTIKIYNNLGVLVFTSAGLDPSTLTTSFAKYSFDLSGNTYIMQTDASIEVSYNTSSASNYVMATYSNDTYPNTAYFNYEGSWPPDIKTSREWSCDIWE
jgi:hypothetical protein